MIIKSKNERQNIGLKKREIQIIPSKWEFVSIISEK